MRSASRMIGAVVLMVTFITQARADLSFETETARMLVPGESELSVASEYQHSKEGSEFALPFAYEIGIHPRVGLLIEPTPYVAISHRNQREIRGAGDTEITTIYLLRTESDSVPALAVAGEVKLPTAHNRAIGTGRLDYTLYLVASKRVGVVDFHANLAYAFVGKPVGVAVQDTTSFAFAAEYLLSRASRVYSELMYTTSGLAGGKEGTGTAAEIGIDELIGTIGIQHRFQSHLAAYGSVSYDSGHATLLRLGATWYF